MCLLGSAGAQSQSVHAVCTVSAQVSLPCATPQPEVSVRGAGGVWQTMDCEMVGEKIIFRLDPGKLGGSEIMLLINPPADLNIDDDTPPALTGIKVDGEPMPAETTLHLGMSADAPRMIRIGVLDADNALDADSVRAALDDSRLEAGSIRLERIAESKASVEVDLGSVEYGSHRAIISIADASPQGNTLEVAVLFDRVDMTNFLMASVADVEFSVSGAFPGYEDLSPLNDGFKDLDGAHCQNDVSWASLEQGGPHWVAARLPEPKTIGEVTVYWAYYSSAYHTSQAIQIQVPDGEGWRTVYSSPAEGHPAGKCTTFSFEPVTTDAIRILQADGGGPAGRPDIMWIAEIEAR